MPQDALNSFTSLLEKAPVWIADLQNILDNATNRQNELLSANQPAHSHTSLPRKKSKTSSLKSKRSKDVKHEEDLTASHTDGVQTETPTPTLLRPQLPHMTDSDALRLSQRKRKTFSACSRDQTAPSKYRSRGLAVVYYDGDVQKRFADLVRDFNGCRNDIRRSKLSAKVDSLARSGSSSSESGGGGSDGEETTKDFDTFDHKTARMMMQEVKAAKRPSGSEVLDKVDGFLEKAQSLCEHAAHQVLRDGDCALEVRQAKEKLEQAKTSAERDLPELKRLAEEAEERRKSDGERQKSQPPPPAAKEKLMLLSSHFSEGPLEVDDIEVDDDADDTDTELEMAALKLPPNLTKYSMRSSRLTAC
ncbi:hypothetical protein WHR41_03239 [Cladosporium halotolerans]|uniref:Uncharacterized protein n=1 Tax=Cladosporium halotolerans TaxID=1052096 RepID=A0AB34KVY1_9PEZI